ncbi:hypothetical protein SNEBB_001260 [Seison nebaliae]|nr:hypothetical protein SNEBB_001260 [Seison nebaliae]
MGILDRITEIEHEISRTQKNKATEYHLGQLKARLAKLREQLINDTDKAGGGKGEGFDVAKSGDARVALIGFPSVGKSTLLSSITKTTSIAAAYQFTTLTCIPGVIEFNGADIQLLDLPGILVDASEGKGRGKQVISVARTSDLVLMMLDAQNGKKQRQLLSIELEKIGIRLNQRPPNVHFRKREGGGISFSSTIKLTKLDEKMARTILRNYKIFNCELLIKEDITTDQLVDVVIGTRKYLPCLYVYNKIDQLTIDQVDALAREPDSVVISCNMKLNFEYLKKSIWTYLNLISVYTKRKSEKPDLDEGIIVRNGSNIRDVCHIIHKSLLKDFRFAYVWGTSVKHQPQRIGLDHVVDHEDIIQIVKK